MKRIFSWFFIACVASLLLPSRVYAAANTQQWFMLTPQEYGKAIPDTTEKNPGVAAETYDISKLTNYMNGYICVSTGCSSSPSHAFYYGKSALASVNKYIGMMYAAPPASTYAFVKDMGQTLGFIPKSTYAQGQGVGFSGLVPLLPVWRAFRNIAYLLLAVVMVVIGFMIMFRKKIDPKTVVTVQNALPKIVVTLLLITFSYAIVGIAIDLMYLVSFLGIALVGSAGGLNIATTQNTYINGGFFTLLGELMKQSASLNPIINWTNQVFSGNTDIWGAIGWGILTITGVTPVIGGLLQLLLSIAYIFAFVRIFFMLLSAYINIILSLIVGPLQILLEAIPGSNSFSSWLKNLISNIVPFPITIVLLVLGNVMTSSVMTGKLWQPPFMPQLGETTGSMAVSIIWLGLAFTIPNIVNGLKEAIKAKPAVPAGMGAILGPMGSGAGQVMQLGYQGMFIASPFLHKQEPSSTLGRAKTAQQGGIEGMDKNIK